MLNEINVCSAFPERAVLMNDARELMEYVPKRTCRNIAPTCNEIVGEAFKFVCSECGYNEPYKDVENALCLWLLDIRFCRKCGAEVLE